MAHPINVDELILTIHSTVFAEDEWIKVGEHLCHALTADSATLNRPSGKPDTRAWCRLVGIDSETFVEEYAERWGSHDVWYRGALRSGRIGAGLVSTGEQLTDYGEYKKTPFFNELLKPMDIDRMMNVCLAPPARDGAYGATAFSFYRRPGKPAFSRDDSSLLSRLAPHLTLAIKNHWSARSLEIRRDAYRSTVDAVGSGVFGIDSAGRLMFANQAGEDLVRQGQWVCVVNSTLRPASNVFESSAFARALHELSAGFSFRCVVTDAITATQAIVSGAQMSAAQNPYPIAAAAIVWVTPMQPSIDVATALARLFELTGAEERLIARLIAGDELREAALHLNISVHTARTQLKAVYRKTGRRTRAALLTLAATLDVLRTSHP